MAATEGTQSSPPGNQGEKPGCNPLKFVPAPGMIVWCRVPEQRQPQYFPPPGPKHRPAFVKSVYKAERPGDCYKIVVIPGTSQAASTGAKYPWDFIFSQEHEDFSLSGLETTTRFTTNGIVAVPFTTDYFDECAVDYLGSTANNLVRKNNALMGYATPIKDIIEVAFGEWMREIAKRKAQTKDRS